MSESERQDKRHEVWDAIESVEAELGLKKDFSWHLYQQEDDWTFIVKLHALIETAISQVISMDFDEPVLSTVQALGLNGRISKLRLVADLHQIPKYYISYVAELSKLRNFLVHNIRNISFSLRQYVANLPPQQKQQFINHSNFGVADYPVAPDGRVYDRDIFVERFPREALFFCGITTLHVLHLIMETIRVHGEIEDQQKQLDEARTILAERYLDLMRRRSTETQQEGK